MTKGMASLAEILASEQFISEFFERSHVGLAVLDSELRYRMLNPYLAASNNTPAECHLGKHVREILGDTAPQVETALQEVFGTARSVVNCEISGALPTRPEGGHWIGNYFPIADSTGKVHQAAAVVVELGNDVHLRLAPDAGSLNAILRSWKDIAHYVGACVKTVQRWEYAHNFPVRRVEPGKGSVVFAFKNEVDRWLRGRAESPDDSFTANAKMIGTLPLLTHLRESKQTQKK